MQKQYEKRKARRMKRYCSVAWISIDGKPAIECDVINVSTAGISMRVQWTAQIAETVDIALVPNGPTHKAKLIWRRGQIAGFEFADR